MVWFPNIYKDKHNIILNNIFSKVYFNSSSLLSVSNVKTNNNLKTIKIKFHSNHNQITQ